MGRGVIAPRGLTTLGVDRCHRNLAGQDFARQPAPVREETTRHVLGVEDLEPTGLRDDRASVADLATRLGVEGGRVQKDFAFALFPNEHGYHRRLQRVPRNVASHELCRTIVLNEIAILSVVSNTEGLCALTRTLSLLCHLFVEDIALNQQTRFGDELARQLNRKAVGVVELKGDPTRK